jgi:hypothetical protein
LFDSQFGKRHQQSNLSRLLFNYNEGEEALSNETELGIGFAPIVELLDLWCLTIGWIRNNV